MRTLLIVAALALPFTACAAGKKAKPVALSAKVTPVVELQAAPKSVPLGGTASAKGGAK